MFGYTEVLDWRQTRCRIIDVRDERLTGKGIFVKKEIVTNFKVIVNLGTCDRLFAVREPLGVGGW